MLHYSLSLPLITLLLQQYWLVDAQIPDDCYNQACGDLLFDYPFGLAGTNCSLLNDGYFAITCNKPLSYHPNNSKPKARLLKFNLELIEYQEMLSYITVKVPVGKACLDLNNKGVSWSSGLDLSGSPFSVDTSRNVFVFVGCDEKASIFNEKGREIGSCQSKCSKLNQEIEECNGYNCCQSDLRSSKPFQNYTMRFTNDVGEREERDCRAGFLASRTFLQTTSSLSYAMGDAANIPVVLLYHYQDPSDDVMGSSKVRSAAAVLLTGGSTLVASCFCFWLCWWCKTRKRRKEIKLKTKYFKRRLQEQWSSNREVVEKTKLFTLKDLKKVTNSFSEDRILGRGGQGTVYKGMLTNGHVVAVKKPKGFDEREWKHFINEVILLSKVNHRNVVRLLGCCLETKAPMLVYEFIPNGTLSEYIHNSQYMLVTWQMRIRIASEAAGAISYLHSSLLTPVYHRDIKSTNILLDESYRAKVADFGISKVVPMDKTHMTTCVQGTFGYLDPEYFRSNRFSEKSDVYSFGVILVELLTGQRPIRETTSEGERILVMYFISSMDTSKLNEILDPTVLEGSKIEEVLIVADLAKRCLKPRGIERPTMKEVVMELEGVRKRLLSTPNAAWQASLDIENVVARSTSEMGNARTSPVLCKDINITIGNCDEKPTYRYTASW